MTNKIIGYALLIAGILLIIVPLWHTYNIFTGSASSPQVFKRPESLKVNQNISSLDIPGQIQNALIKVLPIDFASNILNFIAWLILMWILMYGGGKIADVGIKLIK